ncbi:MAG: PAC2 family protein, partial [Chloroflexi bacterium]|nr:PAC2 family protein [Chloroflexota bacterium]
INAEELGEIEPWEFFYPTKVTIKASVLENLEFPGNKFYYKRLDGKDLIFFIGDEQPTDGGGIYAAGKKAYQLANMVLDVAERFGCRRIYTSDATVTLTHHTLKPRVWAATSRSDLNEKLKDYPNTILMGEVEGSRNRDNIIGLNGLLLGLAKKRGVEGICLMGEIPDYLTRAPFPYPRASKSVLEVLTKFLGIEIDYGALDEMIVRIDSVIDGIYEQLPPRVKERIEQRKSIVEANPGIITEEDEKWIKEHIDEFFQKKGSGDERPS